MDLTPAQIDQLKTLGISKSDHPKSTIYNLRPKSSVLPLLSISGITLLSLGGLILLKSKNNSVSSTIYNLPSTISPSPTQVPKSIQHYLLTSQQYFTQALQSQTENNQNSALQDLNNSILAATQAIKEFPNDFRGYQQRARIYQSLIGSKPELINQAIADLSSAQKLNPNSTEIIHELASLFAKKGDIQNTLACLVKTVTLEPTKAQNFYDLAKIQQQTGLIAEAIATYNQLLPLIADNSQKIQIEAEKTALEALLAQNPTIYDPPSTISPTPASTIDDLPSLQATDITNETGLIIAAPETNKEIAVENLTESNALSGTATLSPNQKDITITNDNLKPESQVYLSIVKGGKNQTLKVQSKSGNSFTAGFDSPLSEEVQFKWWIIN